MHTFKSALSDFTRPINTSFEDSIHMPQNHNNQKRRKAAARKAAHSEGSVEPSGLRVSVGTMKHGAEERPATHSGKQGPEAPAGQITLGKASYPKILEVQETVMKPEPTVQPAPLSPMKVFRRPVLGAAPNSLTMEYVRRLREQEQKDGTVPTSPMFIPNLHLSGGDWAEPLYEIAKPPTAETSGSDQVPASKEMKNLTKAMEEMSVFQSITASPPEHSVSKQESAVQPVLSPGGKSASESHKEVEEIRESRKTQPIQTRQAAHDEANKSTDSFASLSDEFEKVETPAQDESEHNGARRKWYKGFRR